MTTRPTIITQPPTADAPATRFPTATGLATASCADGSRITGRRYLDQQFLQTERYAREGVGITGWMAGAGDRTAAGPVSGRPRALRVWALGE